MMKKLGVIALVALFLIPAGVMAAGHQYKGANSGSDQSPGDIQATPLTDDEIYWLTYLREEEKLARDVYLFLYDEWNMRIFKNIAASEQKHMDAVETLLERYTVTDPSAGKGLGEFSNQDLQDLYDDLIQKGELSKIDALEVGVIIEVTDIDDLEEGIETTTHNDIKTVYSNLLKGSLNHLTAFESELAKY
jgi:hypothetical protein